MSIVFGILAVLCALYGAAVRAIGSGTGFFLVWFGLAVVFAALALAVRFHAFDLLPTIAKRTGAGVVCLVLLVAVVAAGFSISGFDEKGEDDLDCIIVLGAQVRDDGPSIVLKCRLDTAALYLQDNPRTRCIVSGGQSESEPDSEARVMADYLVETWGIDPDRITLEDRSHNTVQNIRNSMELLEPGEERVGIVTNNFHVFRGTAIARKQGIDGAVGIAAPSNPFYLPNNVLREVMGICKDFALRNM